MKKYVLIILSALVICCLIVIVGMNVAMDSFTTNEDEITVTSPEGKNKITIEEFSTLGGSGANIVLNSEKTKHRLSFDNYYQPFKSGKYEVAWEGDRVIIKYYSGVSAQNENDSKTWSVKEIHFGE